MSKLVVKAQTSAKWTGSSPVLTIRIVSNCVELFVSSSIDDLWILLCLPSHTQHMHAPRKRATNIQEVRLVSRSIEISVRSVCSKKRRARKGKAGHSKLPFYFPLPAIVFEKKLRVYNRYMLEYLSCFFFTFSSMKSRSWAHQLRNINTGRFERIGPESHRYPRAPSFSRTNCQWVE